MRDIRHGTARLVAATTGLLTLLFAACRDSTGPVDWLSEVRGSWTGGLVVSLVDGHSGFSRGIRCGELSATIEGAPDGQLSGSWTLAAPSVFDKCGGFPYSGTLTGVITGQTVTLNLATSYGSNLFLTVSRFLNCYDAQVTAAPSATGTIESHEDGRWLSLRADAQLGFWVLTDLWALQETCFPGSGAWHWLASRAP